MSWLRVALSFAFSLLVTLTSAERPAQAADDADGQEHVHMNRRERVRLPSSDPTPPRLPAPIILPDLSHPRVDLKIDTFIGRVTPRSADRPGAYGTITHVGVEGSVIARRLFLGLTYPFAAGLPPDGGLAPGELATANGRRTLSGNTEVHIRSVFPLPTSLEIGFMLAAVAPTATFDRDDRANLSTATAVSSFDPSNQVYFLPQRVSLRPAGDLRVIRGPFVFQGRHGLDITIDGRGTDTVRLAGRLIAHVGYLFGENRRFEVSMEASQLYAFESDEKVTGPSTADRAFIERYRVNDAHRNSINFGPGFRYSMRDLDLGAALLTNVNDPLSPVANRFFAAHISIIAHLPIFGRR